MKRREGESACLGDAMHSVGEEGQGGDLWQR
jgi:hypothetical protein